MTVETCLRLLKLYNNRIKDPSGGDKHMPGTQRSYIKKNSQKAYDDMKAHILKSKKFKDHPIIKELNGEDESTDEEAEHAQKVSDEEGEAQQNGTQPER